MTSIPLRCGGQAKKWAWPEREGDRVARIKCIIYSIIYNIYVYIILMNIIYRGGEKDEESIASLESPSRIV